MKNPLTKLTVGIVLNGPPGCGKDTIANGIVSNRAYDFRKHQFKDALYEHTAKHFAIDLDKFIHYASDRELKDSTSLAGLGGRTPREALIHVSEDIFKPREGNDYFGKAEVNRLEKLYGDLDFRPNVVYPDGGFTAEVECIDAYYDIVVVIRLHRTGFDFSKDSRDYIHLPNTPKRRSIDLHLVDGEIYEAIHQVMIYAETVALLTSIGIYD